MGDQPQGNGTPQVPQGDDAPKTVTLDDVNRAITSRFTEYTKKQNAVFDDRFTSFEKKLVDLLPKAPEPGAPPTDDKSIENHPLFKGALKKISDLEEKTRVAEERAKAEEQRGKDISLRQHVGEALAKANVKDPTRAKHAVSFLVRENLVKWDDAGEQLVFADKDGAVDFETGFKNWLKSDDAKLYLPSPDSAAPQGRQQQQRVALPLGAPPQNTADLSFEEKLALTASQLEKAGIG
jgi:hypothetical protein